jgi:CheY-like chemotaxis protein
VLVVDDSMDQVRSVMLLLKVIGHEARFAINAGRALAVAREFKPAAVILDINLPDGSGFDVARNLRCNPELKHVRIIGITGMDVDPAAARLNGFDELLLKPVDPSTLENLLAEHTGGVN